MGPEPIQGCQRPERAAWWVARSSRSAAARTPCCSVREDVLQRPRASSHTLLVAQRGASAMQHTPPAEQRAGRSDRRGSRRCRTETSSVGIAKRYPPCASRRLSMMFARRSSPKICSRNLSGMCWRRASSATPSGSRAVERQFHQRTYRVFALLSKPPRDNHPTNRSVPLEEIVADIRSGRPGRRAVRGLSNPRGYASSTAFSIAPMSA